MPAGIFTCSHIIFAMVYSFYFLCVGSRRNEFNSLGGEKGERSGVCYYSGSMPVRHFYLLALILYLQWSILFIFCVLAPEGMNSIVLGGIKGTDQKVVAYSDTVSVMLSK